MPAKTNSLTKVPYTRNGSLLHWVNEHHNIWYPNEPFHAALQITGMESGYSAKYVMLRVANSDDPRTFPMFVTDLADAIASIPLIENGILRGRWMVRKRGRNYGVTLAPVATAPDGPKAER